MNARLFFGVAAASIAAACAGTHDDEPNHDAGVDVFSLPARCTSGKTRDPNEAEGPEMMPGHACITCHAETVAATGEDARRIYQIGTHYKSVDETLARLGYAPNRRPGERCIPVQGTDTAPVRRAA